MLRKAIIVGVNLISSFLVVANWNEARSGAVALLLVAIAVDFVLWSSARAEAQRKAEIALEKAREHEDATRVENDLDEILDRGMDGEHYY